MSGEFFSLGVSRREGGTHVGPGDYRPHEAWPAGWLGYTYNTSVGYLWDTDATASRHQHQQVNESE